MHTKSTNMANDELLTNAGVKPKIVANLNGGPYAETTEEFPTKVYKRRWIMLLLFEFVSGVNAFQWIQYSIIANIVMRYYGVSSLMVDNTSLVYMIMYLPLIVPASYLIDKKGLRFSMLVGSIGTAAGSWLKVISVHPDKFYLGFIGQTVVASSQLFTLSIPARLAATWFGPDQVSTACGLGVFGMQLGVALGFVLTPILVKNHENVDAIGDDFYAFFMGVAVFVTVIVIAVVILFEKEPAIPPSRTQALLRQPTKYSAKQFIQSFKNLLTDRGFLCLLFAYGINMGVFNALSTLLNQIMLIHFPGSEEFIGRVGLILVFTGIISSPLFGYLLDKSRKYKASTLVIYLLSAVGMTAFTFSLGTKSHWLVYLSTTLLGFFISGYFFVGYEMAAELTYPEAESNSAGLLNANAQLLGILFTLLFGWLIPFIGDFWTNFGFSALLYFGTLVTALTPNNCRRQDALQVQAGAYEPAPVTDGV